MKLLITGAGFSKAWGLPLTKELAKVIDATMASVPEELDTTNVTHVRTFLAELMRVKGGEPDLENVLTVLREGMDEEYEPGFQDLSRKTWQALGLDMARLWKPPFLDVPDTAYHYHSLVWAIGAALHWNGWGAPPDGIKNSWFGIPQAYARLLQEHGPFDAVISLNYDIVPEYMFYGPIDYGYADEAMLDVIEYTDAADRGTNGQYIHRVKAEPRIRFPESQLVLKLHGSSNMAYCPTCDKVLLFPRRLPGGLEPAEPLAWLRTAAYFCTLHCGEKMPEAPALSPGRLRPLIVPPVEVKEDLAEWQLLKPIQEKAVGLARQATSAIIIGASLRPSDGALTAVLRALQCPVDLIGGPEAEKRLNELSLPYRVLRAYLDESEADRTTLVSNKSRIKMEVVTAETDLGPGATAKGMSRQSWMNLPSIVPDQTYLIAKMSCWPDSRRPRDKVFGDYPTMDVLEDGSRRRLRIPKELREWVIDRICLAHAGARDIPGRVRFSRRVGKWEGIVFGP